MRNTDRRQMETHAVTWLQISPVKDYDKKLEERAERHDCLRGRNNVTSCRSPTIELDTKWMKYEIQYKRYLEFRRRRSISPEQCGSIQKRPRKCQTLGNAHRTYFCGQKSRSDIKYINNQVGTTSNGLPLVTTPSKPMTDRNTSSSEWVTMWLEKETLNKNENHTERNHETALSTSTSVIMDSIQLMGKASKTKKTGNDDDKTNFRQLQKLTPQKKLRDTTGQTGPGFITVKKSEIQQLADYLQEALWREESLNNKLDVVKRGASTLLNSSEKLWKTCFNEDLLRNQIKALEAQLQVSTQKFRTDKVKTFVVQMEKQKEMYEEKALAAVQRATLEKTEALSKAEILQEALQAVKADASRWQGLYEELIEIYNQLKKSEELSTGHVQQLQSQLELCRGRETWLREELEIQQCDGEELHSRIIQIQEDNQTLREEIHHLKEHRAEIRDPMFLQYEPSERPEKEHTVIWGDVDEQFRQTKNRLQLKERECEVLQTELEAMEQEFQSSQGRLAQCRDELVKLSHRQSISNHSSRPCGFWWVVCIFLVLLLIVVGAAMWLCHPPFRDQVDDLSSDIMHRIEKYLLEVKESQHSRCFKPI